MSARTAVGRIASANVAALASASHQPGLFDMVASPLLSLQAWGTPPGSYTAFCPNVNLAADRRPRLGGGYPVDGHGLEEKVLVVTHVAADQDHLGSAPTPCVDGRPGRIRPADGDLDRITACGDHFYPG